MSQVQNFDYNLAEKGTLLLTPEDPPRTLLVLKKLGKGGKSRRARSYGPLIRVLTDKGKIEKVHPSTDWKMIVPPKTP